jgi:hypothetical protein
VSSSFTVTNDPLLYDFDLPFRALYYPLGFPVEVSSNAKEVLTAADESWGLFKQAHSERPLQLQIAVIDGGSRKCPATLERRGQRNLVMRIADAANFNVSDLARGFSYAWVTRALIENRGYFRYDFLEAMSWDLLHAAFLTPIHAACVRLADRGVLLCGDSGAGKSSLSFACAREGWTYLSDDACCLIRKSNNRSVVGNPYQIRFRDSAVQLFPELKDHKVTRRSRGKLSIELPTAHWPAIKTMAESSVDYIVFLRRGESELPHLSAVPQADALAWFQRVINWGPVKMRKAQSASLAHLLEAPIFELRYSDLSGAVAKLEAMVRNDAATSDGAFIASEHCEHA